MGWKGVGLVDFESGDFPIDSEAAWSLRGVSAKFRRDRRPRKIGRPRHSGLTWMLTSAPFQRSSGDKTSKKTLRCSPMAANQSPVQNNSVLNAHARMLIRHVPISKITFFSCDVVLRLKIIFSEWRHWESQERTTYMSVTIGNNADARMQYKIRAQRMLNIWNAPVDIPSTWSR